MSDQIIIPNHSFSKEERYQALIPQIKALVDGEEDFIANVANIIAVLKEAMSFFWIGVYFVKSNELVLGPFQGPVACTRIKFGKGVCGTSWKEKRILNVPNVNDFEGHIACSSETKSEIVLPALRDGEVFLIFDVDSEQSSYFDETDEKYLNQIIKIIETL